MKGVSLCNGYLRYHVGPLRGKYVARVELAKKLGRPLRRNEQADHRNRKKTDNRRSNLQPLNIHKHELVTRQRVKERFTTKDGQPVFFRAIKTRAANRRASRRLPWHW